MSDTSNVEASAGVEGGPEAPLEAAHVEDIQEHVRVYMFVFAALGVLTVVTVAVGYLHLSIGPALAIGLLIALVKGGLVAGYFMHLVSERKVIYFILGITGLFFLFMIVIITSYFYDQIG